jgi:hypothetical protein
MYPACLPCCLSVPNHLRACLSARLLLPAGLQYQEITVGQGAAAVLGSECEIMYAAWLLACLLGCPNYLPTCLPVHALLPAGLQYREITVGQGPAAVLGSECEIMYAAWLPHASLLALLQTTP